MSRTARAGAAVSSLSAIVLAALAALSPGVRAAPQARSAASDPLCTGSYRGAAPRAGARIRFGIDPTIAGSAGGVQLSAVPDNPTRDLHAVVALHPAHRIIVVRLARLFWSAGESAVAQFRRRADRYTRAGFDVELQVRYHPAKGEAGNLAAWKAYVRRVVDAFGPNRRVVAMTITNEVNVTFSPNTSDGYYPRAEDALIGGIEAGHAEAVRRHFHQLRFGFTYAYRFSPSQDSSFFSYIGAHGGPRFRRALGFVGLDFYPGTIYPPVMAPGDTYRAEFAQAAGVLRRCFARKARIPARVPIWITENGVPTGVLSDAMQAAALRQLVKAASDYSATFNVTDYRWFNLRDSDSSPPASLIGPSFASDGLLRANYTPKPSFPVYRALIAKLGRRGGR